MTNININTNKETNLIDITGSDIIFMQGLLENLMDLRVHLKHEENEVWGWLPVTIEQLNHFIAKINHGICEECGSNFSLESKSNSDSKSNNIDMSRYIKLLLKIALLDDSLKPVLIDIITQSPCQKEYPFYNEKKFIELGFIKVTKTNPVLSNVICKSYDDNKNITQWVEKETRYTYNYTLTEEGLLLKTLMGLNDDR